VLSYRASVSEIGVFFCHFKDNLLFLELGLSQTFQVLEGPIQYEFVTEHVVKREKKCPGLCLQASLQIEWQCKLLAECQR